MFSGSVRGGTGGGQGDFKWSDAADDKDRETHLGHSTLARVARWQKNGDLTCYDKEGKPINEDEIRCVTREEIQLMKAAEEDALSAAGFKPTPRDAPTRAPESSSKAVPLGPARGAPPQETAACAEEVEESRKRKAEKAARKAERAAKRERKLQEKIAKGPSSSKSSKNPELDLLRRTALHRHDHVEDGDSARHRHHSHHTDRRRSPYLSGADHERPNRRSDYWLSEHGRHSPSPDSAHSPPRESISTRGSRSPPRAFKELKSRQISEGVAQIRAGLDADRLNPILHAPPWLQMLAAIGPNSPCTLGLSSSKSDSEPPGHQVVTTFEHHIRPPQYTWCGLLDRNAYPKRERIRSYELAELSRVRVVPFFETFDKKLDKSPADKLKDLEQMLREEQYEICLTDRICPDLLRRNFYELVEALNLPSNEHLLRILPPLLPSETIQPPTDDDLLHSLASQMAREDNTTNVSVLLNMFLHAWSRLKESGRLKESPIPVRVISSDFSIADIIDSFRLTLPAHKRIFKDSTFSTQSQICDICQQFNCEGHYDKHTTQVSQPPPPYQSPLPKKPLGILPVETGGYVPCSHSGSCYENKYCDCHQLNTFCDRFCHCPESCSRRYPGCSCGEICGENCECIKLNRECDPLLCKCPAGHLIQESSKCGEKSTSQIRNDRKSTSKQTTISTSNNCCGNFLVATRKKRTFVAPSKIAGFGLFAGEAISSGDYLGEYTGVLLRSDELALQSGLTSLSTTSSYLFDLNELDTIDSSKFGNRARFINEPVAGKRPNADPSVWYVAGSQVIRIFATRPIRIGDEITINYGTMYHARDWA